MSTDLLRNYIDIIKEAEQPQVQLNEGMLQDIKDKAGSVIAQFKSIPGIGKAYQQAKALAPELKQIFAGAKSSKDVIDGIKSLVAAKTGANAMAEDVKPGAAIGALGSTAFITWEAVSGFLDICINAAMQGNAAGIYFVVMPILCAIAAFFMLFYQTDGR
jgi:hypothetical protein